MSTPGLQRRRIPGGKLGPSGNNTSNISSNEVDVASKKNDEDYSSHKIAYDPRDLRETEEQATSPVLTLMEEVLLMGLKDKQGYLSFWNDSISYALRGCILIELALRGKIAMVNDINRKRFPLSDRYIEVIDARLTGETLLDETIKSMKTSEPLTINTWIDYLSGETWNLSKISYQLKQVRERLSKGLVDKGILRTEKKNFFLFEMPTHPLTDTQSKDQIKTRVLNCLTARTIIISPTKYFPETLSLKYLRTLCLICCAYAANVLENILNELSYDDRDQAFSKADQLLNDFSDWPFEKINVNLSESGSNFKTEIIHEVNEDPSKELQLEIIPAVLSIYSNLDSLL
ncbi:Golgi phospho protein 3 [Nadsonia fulvescens var. elongata DSM 6958]|uniref:Golgi phospho protein 3 n=1 Tax=Nadsonia fulvescens var. elongata DSM 6958 TaxID=857566 RepID=A0A1E3PN20_9ASCO|nr:Golgi phospho protein 3 [Nadsonia fulvescens var. elongata DSM 6958]